MATTSPDGIRSPNPSDPYNLVADWAITTNDVQNVFNKRGNMYIGTSAQRNAFTSAPEGTHWQDTNGTKLEYVRQSGVWVALLPDSGWVNCTLAAGVSQQGANLPQVRSIGKMCFIRWGVSGAGFSAGVDKLAFTLPVGFRPSQPDLYCNIAANSAAAAAITIITSSGSVSVRPSATVGTYYMWSGISWVIDS